MPGTTKPSIVFAHGLWADGSSFSKVIPVLQQEGHAVVSAQNALNSLEGDVDAVRGALGRVSGPSILVGHSWGGFVITAAGTDERVAGLVYIAALGPDEGETPQGLASSAPTSPLFSHLDIQGGHIWIAEDGIQHFAGDLPVAEQQVLWATQTAPASELLTAAKMGKPAWKSKPSWYIVAKNDEAVNPDGERFMAKRMGAKTVEADSSHVVMLSHPEIVLDVIRRASHSILA